MVCSGAVLIRPRWKEVAVPVARSIPEVADTVFSTPDDGCCDARNMQSDCAVNKCLHTVASSCTFLLTLNHDARNHELKKMLWDLSVCQKMCEFTYVHLKPSKLTRAIIYPVLRLRLCGAVPPLSRMKSLVKNRHNFATNNENTRQPFFY